MMKPRRGRPLGPIAQGMLARISTEPATLTRLAAELQLNYRTAAYTATRLVSGGFAQYGNPVPGAHLRPARLLEPAASVQPVDQFAALHTALTSKR